MIELEEIFVNDANKMIRCWNFADAPALIQKLSPHGGDEELVFIIPLELEESLDQGTQLYDIMYSGYIKPSRKVVGQYAIYITAH